MKTTNETTIAQPSVNTTTSGLVNLTIANYSGNTLNYFPSSTWFNNGQLKTGATCPATIPNGTKVTIPFTPSPNKSECSGYIVYNLGSLALTFAFSNPSPGSNKVGVGVATGTGSKNSIWSDMTNYYNEWKLIDVVPNNTALMALLQSTADSPNNAEVILIAP